MRLTQCPETTQVKMKRWQAYLSLALVGCAISFAVGLYSSYTQHKNDMSLLTNALNEVQEERDSLLFARPRIQGLGLLNEDLLVLFNNDTLMADLFTCVAVAESGWGLNSRMARECNNLFGLQYVVECTDGKAANNAEQTACYEDPLIGLLDLQDWVTKRGSGPPSATQDFEALLTWLVDTRAYNPNKEHYKRRIRFIRSQLNFS